MLKTSPTLLCETEPKIVKDRLKKTFFARREDIFPLISSDELKRMSGSNRSMHVDLLA